MSGGAWWHAFLPGRDCINVTTMPPLSWSNSPVDKQRSANGSGNVAGAVSRFDCKSEFFEFEMTLDVNVDIYPLKVSAYPAPDGGFGYSRLVLETESYPSMSQQCKSTCVSVLTLLHQDDRMG